MSDPTWPSWQSALNPAMDAGRAISAAYLSRPENVRGLQDATIAGVHAVPEWLRNLIAPAVGRVVTNIVPPVTEGYYDSFANRGGPAGMSGYAKAVIRDEPAYDKYPELTPLWRQYWGMSPRDSEHVYNIHGRDFAFNPQNTWGDREIQSIKLNSLLATPEHPPKNPVLGGFVPGQPDKWNFDIHHNEIPPTGQPYGRMTMLRQLAEAFTGQNAASVQTRYP